MITEQAVFDKYLQFIHPDIINYAIDNKLDPSTASELTENINIDTEVVYFSRMLAHIGMRDGFDGFASDIVPRLRGLYRFALVRDAVNIQKYLELLKSLRNNGIDCICGYFLSVKLGYTKNDTLVSSSVFDIIVYKKHYKNACHILDIESGVTDVSVKICNDRYVWKNAITIEFNNVNLKILNPTSLYIFYSEDIWSSLIDEEMYCPGVLCNRMRWLYYYKIIRLFPEDIDFRILSKKTNRADRCFIRFIFLYASRYFKEESQKEIINKYFPADARYLKKLEEIAQGEFG